LRLFVLGKCEDNASEPPTHPTVHGRGKDLQLTHILGAEFFHTGQERVITLAALIVRRKSHQHQGIRL
jgi:hypothetical protein